MTRTVAFESVGREPPTGLVAEWEQLADDLEASPFLQPGFVLAWWRAFGGPLLHVATVRDRGRLSALLPLVARRGVLASPANWHTPETGVLARDDDDARALARWLLARRPRRLSLAFLDAADPGTGLLEGEIASAGFRTVRRTLANAPYVDLAGSWESFEGQLSSRERNELRRRVRRLDEHGEVTLDVDDGATDLHARLDELVHVEALAWKGAAGTAIGSRADTLGFYRAVAEWAHARGWLRLQALRLDGAPVAVAFALEAHGVLYSLKTGYDPAYRALSPGVLLKRAVIQRAFAEGVRRLELLGDDGRHKRLWSTGAHERIGLQAFSGGLVGRLDHAAHMHAMPLAKRLGAGRLRRRLPGAGGPRL